jgi:hypothetical protein
VSNRLAIATVTEAVRSVLETPVGATVTNAHAFAVRPEDAPGKAPCVNVWLYQVLPNAALRNVDVPTRDPDGGLMRRPTAALDLHYLFTVHGDETKFEPQLILGTVIRELHAQPLLSRKAITDAIAAAKDSLLDLSNLAEAETVRFTPLPLGLDELSKLWASLFQTKFALSVTYSASVVLIEAEQQATPPLPVRSRNVVVVPTLGPVIDRVASRPPASTKPPQPQPIIAGHELHIFGRGLGLTGTRVNITGAPIPLEPKSFSESLVVIDLKIPPLTTLLPGVVTVQILQEVDFGGASGKHDAFASNVVPFILAPVVSAPLKVPGPAVQVTIDPPLVAGRELVLLLNPTAVATKSLRFTATTVAGANQTVPVAGAPAGTYLVRVQIDGAESPLDVDANGNVVGPKVVL